MTKIIGGYTRVGKGTFLFVNLHLGLSPLRSGLLSSNPVGIFAWLNRADLANRHAFGYASLPGVRNIGPYLRHGIKLNLPGCYWAPTSKGVCI
jgi:hypothetical protein